MVMNFKQQFKQFKLAIVIVTGITLAMLLSSCAVLDWFAGKTSDTEVKEMDDAVAKSIAKKTTSYDSSLRKFGKMLRAYNINEIRVQSKLISNQTAEKGLPDDISRMLISSVNKIGNKVIYIPYDPNYMLNEANTGGTINRALPKIVIAGGITEFDKELIEKGRELKTEVSIQKGDFGSRYSHDGGAGYQAQSGISRITLDLQLLDYRSQAYLSGIQAINSINIRKTKLGWGIGYFFQGSGMSFQYSLRKKQGKYHAIRLLVELSVLEILGKYFDVPYWKCIDGMAADTMMINRLRDEFSALPDNQQYSYLKEYMFLHGITGFNRDVKFMTATELAKLEEVQKKYHCNNNSDLFIKLWESVSIPQAIKLNKEYRYAQMKRARTRATQQQQKIARYNALIAQADNLYKNHRMTEARSTYQQANLLFPQQRDPIEMIARIDQAQSQASAQTANVNSKAKMPEIRIAVKAPQPTAAPLTKKNKKEAPLNPFKKDIKW
jgi:hypothetical protein